MTNKKPNIVIIYADDLGFGDVSCYGAKAIPTPNIDRLAENGVKFTQGYAPAATCTPARYGLLTGSYPFRHPRAHILTGDAPSLFVENAPTLPAKLKSAGYKTGIIGKWHLGLGTGEIDWNTELEQTPNDIGFDQSYIMAATNDRVPCVYLDNRKVDNLDPNDPITVSYEEEDREKFKDYPTGRDNPEQLTMKYHHGHDCTIINGVSRIGYMNGGKSALWDDETMCDVFVDKAKTFVDEAQEEPFFLYYALHQPHVPRIPAPRFVGTTPHGPRGDVIVELDWCVGQLTNHLEEKGLLDNTIIIFSSDNGPVLNDGYFDDSVEKRGEHKQAGPLRGGKYSMYEGGARVPFIVHWPAEATPCESDAVICHTDFYATFSTMLGLDLNDDEALDSESMLDVLKGKSKEGRKQLVTEGIGHNTILREDDYVFIPPHEGVSIWPETQTDTGNATFDQLYYLNNDIGQIQNLAHYDKERAKAMKETLDKVMTSEKTRS